jgi:hypothetical protein
MFKKPPQGPSAVLAAGRSFGCENTMRSSCSVQYLTKIASPKYCRHMDKMPSPQRDVYVVFFEQDTYRCLKPLSVLVARSIISVCPSVFIFVSEIT